MEPFYSLGATNPGGAPVTPDSLSPDQANLFLNLAQAAGDVNNSYPALAALANPAPPPSSTYAPDWSFSLAPPPDASQNLPLTLFSPPDTTDNATPTPGNNGNLLSGTAWALDNLGKALDAGQAARAATLAALKIGASPAEQRLFDMMTSSLDGRLGLPGDLITMGSDAANAQAQVQAGADPAQAYAQAAGHSAATIGSGYAGFLLGGALGGPPGAAIGAAIGSQLPDIPIPDDVKLLFPALLIPDAIESTADDIGQYLKNRGW
jgi:hypothetical protein